MKDQLKPFLKLDLVQGSEEWKAERRKYVTASNVPALFALSPYKTKLQYFEELMTGEEEKIDDAKQMLFDIGHNAEEKGREYVESTYGAAFPPAVVVSTVCTELLASLDGFNEEQNVIYESKYVGREIILKIRDAQARGEVWLPAHHECQIQAQLLATGAKKCIYFALAPEGEAAVVEVLPNLDYMHDIGVAVSSFMADLKEGKAPEPSDRDWFDPNDPAFADLAALKTAADEAEAKYEAAKKVVIDKYKEHARVKSGGVIMYRSYVKGNVDYSRIPQLKNLDIEKYRKPGRFQYTVKAAKEGKG